MDTDVLAGNQIGTAFWDNILQVRFFDYIAQNTD